MADDDVDPELVALLRQSLLGLGTSNARNPTDTGVLDSASFIYNNSIDVALDMRGTKDAAARIWDMIQQRRYSLNNWAEHELHPKAKDESTVNFIFVMDLLNFSFWSAGRIEDRFAVEYKGKRWTGYWSLVAGLQRALDEGIPILDPTYWWIDESLVEPPTGSADEVPTAGVAHSVHPKNTEQTSEQEDVEMNSEQPEAEERSKQQDAEKSDEQQDAEKSDEQQDAEKSDEQQDAKSEDPRESDETEAQDPTTREDSAQDDEQQITDETRPANEAEALDEDEKSGQLTEQAEAAADDEPPKTLDLETMQHIFRSATGENMPMLEERLACLKEAGRVLQERFDGSAVELVRRSNHSAAATVNTLADEFSSFRDVHKFEGRRVRLLKKAQIFVADLWAAFEGRDFGEFHDIDKITMFADYRIPQMLVALGCMWYSPPLESRIRRLEPIESGHSWEMQLRGCSIWCIEQIRRQIAGTHPEASVNAILIDFFLYDTAKELEVQSSETAPHHRTRSIWY